MRILYALLVLVGLGLGLPLTTGACGSGGTTDPGTLPDLFNGTYFIQVWEGDIGLPVRCVSIWGAADSDGAGMVTGGTTTENNDGAVSGPTAIPAFPYTIGAGNSFVLNAPTVFNGGIAADGSVAITASLQSGADPGIGIFLQREGSYNLASLNGPYHVCAFFYDAANEVTYFDGLVTFDGVGGAGFAAKRNSNGAIAVPIGPPSAWTYTVAADGAITMTRPGGATFHGGIGGGGELIVVNGATGAALNTQLIMALIPKGAGLSAATLAGTYHSVALSAANPASTSYSCIGGGTFAIDGAGMLTQGASTGNADGTIVPLPAPGGSVPYTVAPDGELGIGIGIGGVAPSGRYAMFSGGSTATSSPLLWLLVR